MEKVNGSRVIIGGLVAGLVMNIGEFILNGVLLAKTIEESMSKINLPSPGGSFIARAVGLTFLVGILAVFIYAAMRPRLGSKAAIVAALVVWFLIFVYGGLMNNAMGIFSMNVTLIGLVWGLVETIVATFIGAWFYRDAEELNALQERRV